MLYLCAALLLLSTSPREKSAKADEKLEYAITNLIRADFKLGIKKSAMIFPILPSTYKTIGQSQPKIDSTNFIHAIGNVQDVKFEILNIQDSLSQNDVALETAILKNIDSTTVLFKWYPNDKLKQSAVYYVTIKATALPTIPNDIKDPETRKYVQDVLERKGRLSDSITFTINVLNMLQSNTLNISEILQSISNRKENNNNIALFDSNGNKLNNRLNENTKTTNNDSNLENSISTLNSQTSIPFELNATNSIIKSVPNGAWNNKIFLSGADANNSNVQFTVKGNARISSQSGAVLVVSGIAPVSGSSKIEISAKRTDGRIAITSFVINTTPLEPPQLPSSFIIGENYRLNFVSEGTPSDQIDIEIYENDKIVSNKNQTGAIVNYTPQSQGKTRLIRYVSNQKADEFSLDVVALPKPNISQPILQNDEFFIITTSFGRFKGLPNKAKLIVDSGNAYDPEEISEKYKFDNINQSHIQVWKVKRKDKNEDFSFHVFAIDQRGSSYKSNALNLNGNDLK